MPKRPVNIFDVAGLATLATQDAADHAREWFVDDHLPHVSDQVLTLARDSVTDRSDSWSVARQPPALSRS
jgi:hypothetical protein